jgi:hypothetical protein
LLRNLLQNLLQNVLYPARSVEILHFALREKAAISRAFEHILDRAQQREPTGQSELGVRVQIQPSAVHNVWAGHLGETDIECADHRRPGRDGHA